VNGTTGIAYVKANYLESLINPVNSNTFSGNTNKEIRLANTTVSSNTRWYYRTDGITPLTYNIYDGALIFSSSTLTIEPGVITKLETSAF
jgi:hypothetical protein